MKKETIKNIERYLSAHGLLSLATIDNNGNPMAHSVEYISEGNTVYFITNFQTRKMANIRKNNNVAYTVDEDYKDWSQIQGIQMIGKASFVENPEEVQRLMGVYIQKFPQVSNFPPEFAESMRVVKIEPLQGRYIDSTKGMGYTEIIEY